MKIGTKSLLIGGHQVVLHPLFVILAWKRLYGAWPTGGWLLACIVHDWGYFGKADMDGDAGKYHPHAGAMIVSAFYDPLIYLGRQKSMLTEEWYWRAACHSRTYADLFDMGPSKLMNADKLATHMYPLWLYALLVWLSGEYIEYRDRWVAAGSYPGKPDDGARAYCRHIQTNWRRFADKEAVAGLAYGGE